MYLGTNKPPFSPVFEIESFKACLSVKRVLLLLFVYNQTIVFGWSLTELRKKKEKLHQFPNNPRRSIKKQSDLCISVFSFLYHETVCLQQVLMAIQRLSPVDSAIFQLSHERHFVLCSLSHSRRFKKRSSAPTLDDSKCYSPFTNCWWMSSKGNKTLRLQKHIMQKCYGYCMRDLR